MRLTIVRVNAEATSVIDLEELKSKDEESRVVRGDVQRADVLQQHYDTIVAGRIGRTRNCQAKHEIGT
jgi:hypothetical protein